MPAHPRPVIAGVDVGGTFTDVVVLDRGEQPRTAKVPTTPHDQSQGLVEGVEVLVDTVDAVTAIAHGTTTATNAVLERSVARTVLVTTEGFRDLLVIGRQERPSLYDLRVVRPQPIVASDLVVTVRERVAADGSVVVPLDDVEIDRVVRAVSAARAESVAVCLLFSFVNDDHERRLAQAITAALDVPVTVSSVLLPEFREYERASTCVLDAAVAPTMRRYLGRLTERAPAATVAVMTSAGGVADVPTVAAAPVHTLLSGPAGGVVAAAAVANQAGYGDAVAFDMGGTSTDVCLIVDGTPQVATEASIGGLPFAVPAVAVHTVGAGGGSIAEVDVGGALRVGPRSAGAQPGPASYGTGGTSPTVTDAHVTLGHLRSGQQLGDSALRLDTAAAQRALSTLPGFASAEEAADGVIQVVGAAMLRALRRVTTEQGIDPATLAVVAYGGAGPLHATSLGEQLGCAAVLIPPAPGVLSALGLLLAAPRVEQSRTIMVDWPRDGSSPALEPVWRALRDQPHAIAEPTTTRRLADCRYTGQSHELRLEVPDDGDLAAAFDRAHERAYGYALTDETVQVVTVRVVIEGQPALDALPREWGHPPMDVDRETSAVIGGRRVTVPIVDRASLEPGARVSGPALVVQADTTTLLRPGDDAEALVGGTLAVTW